MRQRRTASETCRCSGDREAQAVVTSAQATYMAHARVRDHAAKILRTALNHYVQAFAALQQLSLWGRRERFLARAT